MQRCEPEGRMHMQEKAHYIDDWRLILLVGDDAVNRTISATNGRGMRDAASESILYSEVGKV